MRIALFAMLVTLAALGCDGKPLTGPDAQRVVEQAKSAHINFDSGPVIFLDGVRVDGNSTIQNLDPATIESVEIVKSTVAPSTYGSKAAGRGVVRITTKKFASSHRAS